MLLLLAICLVFNLNPAYSNENLIKSQRMHPETIKVIHETNTYNILNQSANDNKDNYRNITNNNDTSNSDFNEFVRNKPVTETTDISKNESNNDRQYHDSNIEIATPLAPINNNNHTESQDEVSVNKTLSTNNAQNISKTNNSRSLGFSYDYFSGELNVLLLESVNNKNLSKNSTGNAVNKEEFIDKTLRDNNDLLKVQGELANKSDNLTKIETDSSLLKDSKNVSDITKVNLTVAEEDNVPAKKDNFIIENKTNNIINTRNPIYSPHTVKIQRKSLKYVA